MGALWLNHRDWTQLSDIILYLSQLKKTELHYGNVTLSFGFISIFIEIKHRPALISNHLQTL